MSTSKKRITRKPGNKIKFVTFEVPEFFDGEFKLPSMDQLSRKYRKRLGSDEVDPDGPIEDFMRDNGADVEADVYNEMTAEETKAFISAWQDASGVTVPKSED